MLRALSTAVFLLLVPVTGEARQQGPAQKSTSKARNAAKKKKNARFDPADFLKKKEQHAQPGTAAVAGNTASSPLSLKQRGVVCTPKKNLDNCFGADCKKQVVTEQQTQADAAAPTANPTDSTRLTADLMKTIKENCTQELSSEPSVKPVFEIGVRQDPATAGSPENKEVIPKLGIQAAF